MRITSKGQVTIPQAIRNATGLLPNTNVDIIYENGEVLLRPARQGSGATFAANLKSARSVPLTQAFRGKSADEIMDFLRGE